MLDARDITVSFEGRKVLERATISVADGEVVALLGPSGSGKSTLLRVIAGIVVADAGTVMLDGRDVTNLPTHRRGVGMVFQDDQLFPHRDVEGNVAFGLDVARVGSKAQRSARVAEVLDLVGMVGFERRRVAELSGGEAKRVALARSLAPAPRALLLDEPLTGLDRELHDRLAVDLAGVLRAAGTTALVVTHDRDEAGTVADRVVTMGELQSPAAGHSGHTIVALDAPDTWPLRREVLRTGTPSREVALTGDDDPDTIHLGVRDEWGRVIAVSTWIRRGIDAAPSVAAVQLRAMAIEPAQQRSGIGARLLEHGIAAVTERGAELVWATARDSALDFYTSHGFSVEGDGFLDDATGLPHHRVIRRM